MPIKNVGTLLENLVVVESAMQLTVGCAASGGPFEFINSFAMPPRSMWIPHPLNVGFEDQTLDRVQASIAANGYPKYLRACLQADRETGPSAALLVLGALRDQAVGARLWLNDIKAGHYPDTIPSLQNMLSAADDVYGVAPSAQPIDLSVSSVPYPESLGGLSRTLSDWETVSPATARLAFLDPMQYSLGHRGTAETSSDDHRNWLVAVGLKGPTIAVHFTSNRDQRLLLEGLNAMHQDAAFAGYPTSRAFKRQHYAVFCAVRSNELVEALELADQLERRVKRAWSEWCSNSPTVKNPNLTSFRDGVRLDSD